MQFWPAVSSALSNYVNFRGRAVRSEYWYWILFVSLVGVAATMLDLAFVAHRHGPFESIWQLATILPGLAVSTRRLHDIDCSGWWLVALFGAIGMLGVLFAITGNFILPVICILIVSLALIYWFCQPGTAGPNRYGPDPFGPNGGLSRLPTV